MNSWYKNGIFYHIYPLGLCGSPKENHGGEVVNRFDEMEEWIPHIKNIGCNALYIGPLFESTGHGYETTDYKLVDRRLGDNKSFKIFTEKCHENGIKVIVDGVFNHTGREFFAFQELKENKGNARYKDWYSGVRFDCNNEYNDGFCYEAWRGYNILVKLNLKNPEVKQYLFDVIKFWVDEFNIDGIRLDCADVLDFDFMKEMRSVCNDLKEDFWLMGEVIHGDYSRWANAETLHSVTNYELHKGLYSGHNDHNYFEIAHTVKRISSPEGGICKDADLYNFVDNHDVDRIIDKINVKEHIVPITILLYTLPGLPSIYYGSEFLIEGKRTNYSDDMLRPALSLSDYADKDGSGSLEYKEAYRDYIDLLKQLSDIRSEYKELSDGYYRELLLTNRQYAFARIAGDHAVIAAVNNDEKEAVITIPLPMNGTICKDLINNKELPVTDGKVTITLKENHGVVLYI